MGLFRLLLALSVLFSHIGRPMRLQLVGGDVAVEIFFAISGFYMAMILTDKYVGPGSYRLFLSNRLLRLFPAYWAVLAATAVFFLAAGTLRGHRGPLDRYADGTPAPTAAVLTLVDLTIVGQDQICFMAVGPHGWPAYAPGALAPNPGTPHPLWMLLLVPQAWSLSLELAFYLIAPFLNRLSSRSLLAVAAASLALRVYLYAGRGLAHDPWTYRFFPCELLLFVAGMLAFRSLRRMRAAGHCPGRLPLTLVATGTFAALFLYPALPHTVAAGFELRTWAIVALGWAAVPYLFLWSNPPRGQWDRFRRIDRYVGELSYPLYIVHLLALSACVKLSISRWPATYPPAVIGLAVAAAVALHYVVVRPVERVRDRRARTASPAVEAAANVVNP